MPSMRWLYRIAPPVAIMVLDGMQSHRWAAPPTMSRSIRMTSAPSRAAWVAAVLPPGPPPMITTRTAMSAIGLIDAELGPQHVAHLAERGPAAQRLAHGIEQVGAPPGGGGHLGQGSIDRGLVALGPGAADPL